MTQSGGASTSQGLHRLDDLDIRIIRELRSPGSPQWNVRESYSEISRKLGVDEETIRRRVKRAKEHGFLPAWRMMINPRLIGCESAGLDLEVGDEGRKPKAISEIRLVEGVTTIVDFRGRGLQIVLYYESDDELERKTQLIRSICSAPRIVRWKSAFAKPDMTMKRIDWEIVDAMKEDARRDLEDVARSLRVSVRTVQRRLAMLTEGKAAYLVGTPNVEKLGGLICSFLVFCPDQAKKRSADKLAQSTISRIGASDTSPEQYSTFGVACENLSEADAILARLKALDGVESVRMGIVKEFISVDDWLFGEIHNRVRES